MNFLPMVLRRPVTLVVAIVALVLTALFGLNRMPKDVFPPLNVPTIYVAQPFGGMEAGQMEGFLTYYYEYHFLYITGIEHAFIYGSWARRSEGESGEDPGDIDVLVVGAPQVDEVYEACRRASTRLHREVNATILSESEWASDTVFTREVRSGALIPVVLEVA